MFNCKKFSSAADTDIPSGENVADALRTSHTVSIVVRTLNEARYLERLLQGIAAQETYTLKSEVVLVDSGSTDGTLEIARQYGCRIVHIAPAAFTFGRALNLGCQAATGEILVCISGHCVPADSAWLQQLVTPLVNESAEYSYGRQIGGPLSHFSETRVFAKYFPHASSIPQNGFYCNNANSALLRSVWLKYGFNSSISGLEDMELAQRLVSDGGRVAYIAEAIVFHHHSETWSQVRRRFEREAIALKDIMPDVHLTLIDVIRYVALSVWGDITASKSSNARASLRSIFLYRWNQYFGAWKGNSFSRKLSKAKKASYFCSSLEREPRQSTASLLDKENAKGSWQAAPF